MQTHHISEEYREQLTDELNTLIGICKDGQAGYQSAIDSTNDVVLKELFGRLTTQRAVFAAQLKGAVETLGCKPRETGTLEGALHRGWANIVASLKKDEAHTVLAECGEDAAVEAYRKVLSEAPLNGELRSLVSTQAAAVKDTHDEIRLLRDAPVYTQAN